MLEEYEKKVPTDLIKISGSITRKINSYKKFLSDFDLFKDYNINREHEMNMDSTTLEMISEITYSKSFKRMLANNDIVKKSNLSARECIKGEFECFTNISTFNQNSFHNVKRHFKYRNDFKVNKDLCNSFFFKVIPS